METQELLRRFLEVQQRRAMLYSTMQKGFADYLASKSELAYKELCSQMTTEFNKCSQEVIAIEMELREPPHEREDLANVLQTLQSHEKTKLQMTATLQVLKRVGHPSERDSQTKECSSSSHLSCSNHAAPASGLEECEAEAEYLAAHKEAVNNLQGAVMAIHDLVETIRYEIEEFGTAAIQL